MAKDKLAEFVVNKWNSLGAVRGTWRDHWQDCADYVLPRKNNITITVFPGDKRNLQLYDSSAQHANEILASALHGMLTNPTVKWFDFSTGNEELDRDDDVADFLEYASSVMHDVLNNSNFQTEIHEVYIDLGCFGTAPLLIEEDDDAHVRFKAKNIGYTYIDESRKGIVDTVVNEFEWTARQVAQQWDANVLGRRFMEKARKMPEEKIKILHAIMPTEDMGLDNRAPFAEAYVITNDGAYKTVETGYFNEFPYAVPRWSKATGETYGRSPSMKALPDIKMLQEVSRTTIRGAQKTVDPPIMIPDEGFIRPVRTQPGGLNYYRAGSNDRAEPLITNARVDFGFQFIENLKKQIRDAFFINELQLQEGPQMTATEVMQRTEEKVRILSPVLGRLHSELLRPIVDRTFGILLRKNVIERERIPGSLQGRNLDIRYRSLIARAQKAQEAQIIAQTLGEISPFMQIDQTVIDNLNNDESLRHIAQLRGLPRVMLRKRDEVEEIRQARSEAQAQQLERMDQSQDVEDASKLAKALPQQG